MDLAARHPGTETAGGLALGGISYATAHAHSWLDSFVSFGVDYITPIASEIAAVGGALFTIHGAYRWVRRKFASEYGRRDKDRH